MKKAFSQRISNICNGVEALEFLTAPNISISLFFTSGQELEK